jgi:hypothetical protein
MGIPKLDGATELTISRTLVDELELYLKSEVLYWPISPLNPLGDKMPPLTIGGLLEAMAWAEAARDELSGTQQAELQTIRQQHDRIRAAHQVAYHSKATREIGSRLDAWSTFLDDAERRPDDVAPYYPHEVRARAKAELLAQALGRELPSAEQQRLNLMDVRLRAMFQPGPFIWDERLKTAFPPHICWWLYGRVPD